MTPKSPGILLRCLKEASHTQTVFVSTINETIESSSPPSSPSLSKVERRKEKKKKKRKLRESLVQVITESKSSSSQPVQSHPLATTTRVLIRIHVKPLVILDLNGILCRRLRTTRGNNNDNEETKKRIYRDPIGHRCNSFIIARTDLMTFLTFLNKNFTLAVWTSAKRQTAKELVDLLFPYEISKRLLFIWGQNKCQSIIIRGREYYNNVCFTKPLSKVWNEFPLWDESNTLLVDDSYEKCPVEYRSNAIHPPAILGYSSVEAPLSQEKEEKGPRNSIDDPDLMNQEKQILFFQRFANYWDAETEIEQQQQQEEKSPNLQQSSSSSSSSPPKKKSRCEMEDLTRRTAKWISEETCKDNDDKSVISFLRQHGRGDMGWRGQ